MALTLRGERAGERRRTATTDEITYERTFVVHTDDDGIGPREVSFCAGIPLNGVTYATENETDPLCKVVKRDAEPVDEHRRLWEVKISYSSKQTENEDEDADPEREPPEVSLTHATRMKAILGPVVKMRYVGGGAPPEPVNGQKGGVLSSAGEPFDPPAEDEEHYPILTVTRNERNLNMAKVRRFVGSVNSDQWLGADLRMMKCTAIDARKVFKKGYRYWRVTYVVEFNPDNWDMKLLDHGTFYIDGDTAEKKLFVTDDTPPQPRLGLLDGKGQPLGDGVEPVFQIWRRRPEVPFVELGLETAIFG